MLKHKTQFTAPRFFTGGALPIFAIGMLVLTLGCQNQETSNPPPAPPAAKTDMEKAPEEARKAAEMGEKSGAFYQKQGQERASQMEADMKKAEAAKRK